MIVNCGGKKHTTMWIQTSKQVVICSQVRFCKDSKQKFLISQGAVEIGKGDGKRNDKSCALFTSDSVILLRTRS